MSKWNCQIRIGTSGWYYSHWRKLFYPDDLPKSRWFEYYAQHFDTVEINNSFYHLPKLQSVKRWYRLAPDEFIYAVKANRYITHIKRLKDVSDEMWRFFETMAFLKGKLGPVLYQLPPSLHKDLDLLKSFINVLGKDSSAVFEFRDKSWFSQDTYELLDKFGIGFCVHDMSGVSSPRTVTGKLIYLRFHGPTGKYEGSYSKSALADWAQWIKQHRHKVRGVYAYFNNDSQAHAVCNAGTLKELI